MSKGVVFDRESAERIAETVHVVERRDLGGSRRNGKTRAPTGTSYYVRLTGDLSYAGTAVAQVQKGTAFTDAGWTLDVTNRLYRKLWSGAYCLVQWSIVEESNGAWRITWSDSAARVRGVATSAISANSSGTVSTIVPIDGRSAPAAPITVHSVLTNYAIVSGVQVWAEWNQTQNRWEAYAADCAP